MWLITSKGFLSVVADRNNSDQLLIRARSRDDLIKVVSLAESKQIEGIYLKDIFEDLSADYRYRIFVPKSSFADLSSLLVEEINYPNFKNKVAENDSERAHLYSNVWHTLYQIQAD